MTNSELEESESESDHESNKMFNIYDTWEEETRSLHATIQTIKDIPIGKSQIYLCLDRNAGELVHDNLKINYKIGHKIRPSMVFHNNYFIKYTKTGEGLDGTFIIACGIGKINDPIKDIRKDLDIEYAPDCWYPMKNGYLPAKDNQRIIKLLGVSKQWSSFKPSTRLGWRGPMIPIELIDKIPITFYL